MAKIKIDDGTVRANDIQLEQIEIVIDTAQPKKVEIYMLDQSGHRVEGGTFDRNEFMNLILAFYRQYY
jgi:hypothetical protein